MELYTIPFEDKFIIYRPLLRVAFIGNQAMANLATDIATGNKPKPSPTVEFLDDIGFLNPDPP